VETPVRTGEKLAPVVGIRLGFCNCLGISGNAQAIEETPGICGIA